MQRLKPLAISTLFLFFISACGQKGPLYLPQADEPVPAASAEDSEDENGKGNNEKNS